MAWEKQEKKTLPFLKKVWHFIWHDDSIWSWLVNLVLAFVLIKFIVFPVLGLIFSTGYPIVAVVSSSMEHQGNFEQFWGKAGAWYEDKNIAKEQFKDFYWKNGFNRGDVLFLRGKAAEDIQVGEVIVFQSSKPQPIIHRVVKKWQENGKYYFQTKGDNNPDSLNLKNGNIDETKISQEYVIGKAWLRLPYLGWVKIGFAWVLFKLTGFQMS
ncbi:MAG TPA: signal peptidase I [Candidatus Nanoarchaeia archaeon]|nr:signal peptidase I [Candidatus Nanoarchaeia archaeon]